MGNQLDALLHDPELKGLFDVNYMRFEQREEHQRDIAEVEQVLDDPARRKAVTNPGRLRQQVEIRKRNLARQTPPPLTPSQRDKVARIEQAALAQFREGMPTQEQMRHAPPGALDHHTAWEQTNKHAVILWKRARLLLNPGSRERDLCNIERFRPSAATRSLMTDGQINRPFALSAEAKANWDAIDWHSPEVATEIQRLVDEGKVRINATARRGALRQPRATGKVYECSRPECSGQIFSGGWAKARYNKHMDQHRLVTVGGAT